MHILIAGASGLIGQRLIPILQHAGHQVSVLSTQDNPNTFSTSISSFHWSPEKGKIDINALNGVEVIINLAGATVAQRWTAKNKKAIFESRVLGTRLLAESLKNSNHNVSHFISASAIGVYPAHPDTIYTETSTLISQDFLGQLVHAWENEVDSLLGVVPHCSKIRIGLVLAKEGGALIPLALPASFGFGAWFGSGKQWQSWIHIDDIARLFVFALEHPGCYNGVAPNPISQKNLIKAIARVYNKPQWLPGIPKVVLQLGMGAMSKILYDSICVSSAYAVTKGFSFQFSTIEEALNDLLPLGAKK
ncbi:MAG: TIGR01777 family oxidoreductase [Flavobacteriaceae bacterium]|nr:TIGR01777 family oxidoreductase [Flavobacteriaceae bacterium]